MTRIKVCGITNLEDALLALSLGVEAIGFIFSESQRQVSIDRARKIIRQLPPWLIKVGVFVDEPAALVEKVYRDLALDLIQLHGQENEEYVRNLNCKWFKAFKVGVQVNLSEVISLGRGFFLLDSAIKGVAFNWSMARNLKEVGRFFVSGGLNPENVVEALSLIEPFGVDVCSGVESYPGKKDPEKMKEFVWRIRKWDCQKLSMEYSAEDLSRKR